MGRMPRDSKSYAIILWWLLNAKLTSAGAPAVFIFPGLHTIYQWACLDPLILLTGLSTLGVANILSLSHPKGNFIALLATL